MPEHYWRKLILLAQFPSQKSLIVPSVDLWPLIICYRTSSCWHNALMDSLIDTYTDRFQCDQIHHNPGISQLAQCENHYLPDGHSPSFGWKISERLFQQVLMCSALRFNSGKLARSALPSFSTLTMSWAMNVLIHLQNITTVWAPSNERDCLNTFSPKHSLISAPSVWSIPFWCGIWRALALEPGGLSSINCSKSCTIDWTLLCGKAYSSWIFIKKSPKLRVYWSQKSFGKPWPFSSSDSSRCASRKSADVMKGWLPVSCRVLLRSSLFTSDNVVWQWPWEICVYILDFWNLHTLFHYDVIKFPNTAEPYWKNVSKDSWCKCMWSIKWKVNSKN